MRDRQWPCKWQMYIHVYRTCSQCVHGKLTEGRKSLTGRNGPQKNKLSPRLQLQCMPFHVAQPVDVVASRRTWWAPAKFRPLQNSDRPWPSCGPPCRNRSHPQASRIWPANAKQLLVALLCCEVTVYKLRATVASYSGNYCTQVYVGREYVLYENKGDRQ